MRCSLLAIGPRYLSLMTGTPNEMSDYIVTTWQPSLTPSCHNKVWPKSLFTAPHSWPGIPHSQESIWGDQFYGREIHDRTTWSDFPTTSGNVQPHTKISILHLIGKETIIPVHRAFNKRGKGWWNWKCRTFETFLWTRALPGSRKRWTILREMRNFINIAVEYSI